MPHGSRLGIKTIAALTAGGVAGTLALSAPAMAQTPTPYGISVPKCVKSDGDFTVEGTRWVTEVDTMGRVPVAIELRDGRGKAFERSGSDVKNNPSGSSDSTVWEALTSGGDGNFSQEIDVPGGVTGEQLLEVRVYSDSSTSVQKASAVTADVRVVSDTSVASCDGKVTAKPERPATQQPGTGEDDEAETGAGIPNPLDSERNLTAATRNGVEVKTTRNEIEVTIPGAVQGDKVFLSTYLTDNTRVTAWGDRWFTVDDNGKIFVPRSGDTKLMGTEKLVVQNAQGVLVGWAPYKVAGAVGEDGAIRDALDDAAMEVGERVSQAVIDELDAAREGATENGDDEGEVVSEETGQESTAATSQQSGQRSSNQAQDRQSNTRTVTTVRRSSSSGGSGARITTPTVGGGSSSSDSGGSGSSPGSTSGGSPNSSGTSENAAASSKPQPKNAPKAPFKSGDRLTDDNRGRITATIDGTVLNILAVGQRKGDWLYIYMYSPEPEELGWAQIDNSGRIAIETADMGPGSYKFALVNEKGKLIGWTDLDITDEAGQIEQTSGGFDTWDVLYIVGALAIVVLLVGVALVIGQRMKSKY